MNLIDHIRTGWLEIKAHKLRSFLSFFAISIGVASILYTLAQIQNIRRQVSQGLELMGPGRMEISKKRDYATRGLSPGLTSEDAGEIRRLMPALHMVSPVATAWGRRMRYQDFNNQEIMVRGITTEWRRRDWVYKVRGRFFDSEDARMGHRVCLLIEPGGWKKKPFWAKYFPERALEKLLKRRDLLGKAVLLGDSLFTVVGILKEPPRDEDPRWEHSSWGQSGIALVPLSTFQRTFASVGREGSNPRAVNEIHVDTGEEATVPIYKKRIETLLKSLHRGESDYEVKDNRELIQGVLNNVRMYLIAILAVGIVAILSGGIGIMNVTLATIYSRVREIGVRRAVGATRLDIILQFVVEAMTLGFLGGLAGVVLGMAGTYYLSQGGEEWRSLSAAHVLFSLAVAVGTGFLFALYPASQASKLDPIEALRYE